MVLLSHTSVSALWSSNRITVCFTHEHSISEKGLEPVTFYISVGNNSISQTKYKKRKVYWGSTAAVLQVLGSSDDLFLLTESRGDSEYRRKSKTCAVLSSSAFRLTRIQSWGFTLMTDMPFPAAQLQTLQSDEISTPSYFTMGIQFQHRNPQRTRLSCPQTTTAFLLKSKLSISLTRAGTSAAGPGRCSTQATDGRAFPVKDPAPFLRTHSDWLLHRAPHDCG